MFQHTFTEISSIAIYITADGTVRYSHRETRCKQYMVAFPGVNLHPVRYGPETEGQKHRQMDRYVEKQRRKNTSRKKHSQTELQAIYTGLWTFVLLDYRPRNIYLHVCLAVLPWVWGFSWVGIGTVTYPRGLVGVLREFFNRRCKRHRV